jgi:hypothetical protein
MPDSWHTTRGRLAALSRVLPPGDPQLEALRAQLKAEREPILRDKQAEKLAGAITRLVGNAPPLTDEQVAHLGAIVNAAPRERAAS